MSFENLLKKIEELNKGNKRTINVVIYSDGSGQFQVADDETPIISFNSLEELKLLIDSSAPIRTKLYGSFCQTAVMCWAVYQH